EKISKDDLILLKNSMLAYRGYQFKDKDVTKYFSKFIWYIPIENNDIVNNIFSRIERDIYDIIEKIVQKK
ncbi:MAG: YARHG domain-containing protein, partial [Spirochaetes bacterium]|nr:YARHG domain-containing protein [Spirochaetota bacterium]